MTFKSAWWLLQNKELQTEAEKNSNNFVSLKFVIEKYKIETNGESIDQLLKKIKIIPTIEIEGENIRKKDKVNIRKVILSGVNSNTFDFSTILNDKCFTIMQYNILADFLCNSQCSTKQSRDWENRKLLIINGNFILKF